MWLVIHWVGCRYNKPRQGFAGLGGWFISSISIYRGIITGYNQAFIINNDTKCALVAEDPKSAEILKPILRGRDIQRYQAKWAGLWLIYSHAGIDIDAYPAIKQHLLPHKLKLQKRTGGARRDRSGNVFVPYKWYELQVDYYHSGSYKKFEKDKIVYPNMTKFLPFHYDEYGYFTNQKCYVITGKHLKYLCGVLSSSVAARWIRENCPELGEDRIELSKIFFKNIPIPKISDAEQQPTIDLVDKIIKAKQQAADTTILEAKIDQMIYQLYGLTKAETELIES